MACSAHDRPLFVFSAVLISFCLNLLRRCPFHCVRSSRTWDSGLKPALLLVAAYGVAKFFLGPYTLSIS